HLPDPGRVGPGVDHALEASRCGTRIAYLPFLVLGPSTLGPYSGIPYDPHFRSTSPRTSALISTSAGHSRGWRSSSSLRVASIPILAPTPGRAAAWSSGSSGPSSTVTSRRQSTLALVRQAQAAKLGRAA